jgi:signal transduction histidine kinase
MPAAPSRIGLVKVGLLIASWTAYGLLCAWQAHYWYSFTRTPMSWFDALRWELAYAWLWCAATPFVVWLARRFPIERNRWRRSLPVHLAALLVLVPLLKLTFDGLTNPPTSAFHNFTWAGMVRSVESTLDDSTLLYALIVLTEHMLSYYSRYQSSRVEASQFQTQLVHAQLRALRMQLHPHFLFNTLHTIASLVREDPARAERTIAQLGELLRFFLNSSSIHEVPLGEEMRVLELYLDIERARFEDRLRVFYNVPADLREAIVPNLVLQPLVENSIRHGLSRRAGPGHITISAERFENTLVLRVTDNGAGLGNDSEDSPPRGVGLAITRGRLESLYGGQQSFLLCNLPGGGAEARITLPFRPQSAQQHGDNYVELQSADC